MSRESVARGQNSTIVLFPQRGLPAAVGRGGAVVTRPVRPECPNASSLRITVRPECPDASSGCIEGAAKLSPWGGADTSIDVKVACALRYAPVKHRR